ncbi:hypothetical protein ACJW30_11G054800 [Castanea mollissima]
MIGRADIEGSKSNVAMNAWLPQASYPCGNFSDTSSFKFRRSKGSIGHAFTVRIRTGNQNQTSFYPFVPHEISVLVELILGHLRYLLTDVPPQPNSPPDNVFRPDRPAEASLGSKKKGRAPLPIHGISKITLKVVTAEAVVPSPSPGRHAATRSRRGSSSSSPPTADGLGTGTPVPSPQSQSFSRGYGSILPTSLAYIVPSTRGCSPWRPDAVMSTTGRGRHSVLRIFKGRRGRTGHHATSHLNICYYHQDLHRRPLRPGSRPRFCSGRRALLLIGAWNLPRRPEFPLASPRSGIVHHLSGPDRYALTRTLLRRSSFLAPYGFTGPLTRTHVRLLGARCQPRSRQRRLRGHNYSPGLGRRRNPHRSTPRVDRRTGSRRSTSDRGASPAPIRFPPDNFKHSLTLFSKSFSSFPRGTCLLSVSRPYLALDGIYRPIGAAFPNNPTRRQRLVVRQGPGTTGLSPSPAPPSRGLGPGPPLRTLLQTTIRRRPVAEATRSRARSGDGARTTGNEGRRTTDCRGARRRGLAFGLTARAGAHGRPTSAPAPNRSRRALGRMASGATCVQKLDDSRDSAIHTKYRISLRSSSMREPRYPLPRVVQWTSRDVAGSEPPTSPRSEHFTGPFNRQITPPTKNGHAPPPIESRKSSQSVNPYYAPLLVSFVFHKSKNFTSDYEIRMPPTVPERIAGRRDEQTGAHQGRTALPNPSWNYRGCWHQTCPPMDPPVSQAPSPESNPNSPSPVTTIGRNLNDASPARWPCDPSSYHESAEQRAEPASAFYLINASLPEVGVCCTY